MASLPAQLIGVDVGGTKTAAALVGAETGQMSRRLEIATAPERGVGPVVADIVSLVQDVAAGEPIAAVGVGLPELVDGEGAIRSAYLLDWQQGGLAEHLAAVAPVRFESDVRAAALAETTHGAGEPYDLFVYISLGTGISSTLVQHGVPLVGARGGALVLSSGSLGVPCPECSNWTEFVLESYASGPALARRYSEVTGRTVAGAETVIAAANAGDGAAVQIVESAADALGSALGWLINVVDPEAIVVGGGLGLAPGRFRDRLEYATRNHIWNAGARTLPFLSAALGPDAGLIGAALSTHHRATTSGHLPERPIAATTGERR